VLALAFLAANQLGVLASSRPTPPPGTLNVAVLRLPLEPNDRCVKRVIAKNRQFGTAVVAERLKQCLVVTVVTARQPVSACLNSFPSVILSPLPPANQTPVPGCVGVSPRGS
jgi:hypothetical protein